MKGRVEKWVVMGEGRMGEDGRDRENGSLLNIHTTQEGT